MSNVSSVKPGSNSRHDSPKTPGGISKSHLTPCRRVGLSKKWRKSGPSPFVSPLASANSPREGSDRTKTMPHPIKLTPNSKEEENCGGEQFASNHDELSKENEDAVLNRASANVDIVTTPLRSVHSIRKSKSKCLMSLDSIDECPKDISRPCTNVADNILENKDININKDEETISKPVKSKSKSMKKPKSPKIDVTAKDLKESEKVSELDNKDEINTLISSPEKDYSYSVKEKSPNNLTKECIVVIQRKINKNAITKKDNSCDKTEKILLEEKNKANLVSQALFDSDSDEAPLSTITKKASVENIDVEMKKRPRQLALDDDEDDFTDTDKRPNKLKKLEDKSTSISDLKTSAKTNLSHKHKEKSIPKKIVVNKPISQMSFDDDDDFDFSSKRTILIRKSYDKVIKPQKAKSTGSVTQKDIDDLKAKIEMKKNLILAKAMTSETEDLRNLIKKWKKGCQDALAELMDLMKSKFPEKQYMDYSEILQMLKIPSALVGYDSDNDCFTSPDDANIILDRIL
ncbi:unnamed protein product [Plutella xylostella]|uniref:(diamondback moth) hypothetical protein n=1 Tax=Plutella xylostella TaxID=51655 RepID=A0A8S4G740_PLUXY|nr:unnamed protein product [Plutella xylostella]